MNNKTICVTGVIDIDLWNKASWAGMVVLSDKVTAPYLGLLFENRAAAIQIFKEWNTFFGSKDIYEEIRIAIIEGKISGEEGYTVHITTNTENLISKCKKLNLKIDQTLFAIVSRFKRINANNRNITIFREEFERFLSYKIVPVYMNGHNLEPLLEYEIEKTEIYFRQVDEIVDGDIDRVCIKSRT